MTMYPTAANLFRLLYDSSMNNVQAANIVWKAMKKQSKVVLYLCSLALTAGKYNPQHNQYESFFVLQIGHIPASLTICFPLRLCHPIQPFYMHTTLYHPCFIECFMSLWTSCNLPKIRLTLCLSHPLSLCNPMPLKVIFEVFFYFSLLVSTPCFHTFYIFLGMG